MSCYRCNGLCVRVFLVEREHHVPIVKCVNCGNMIDYQIVMNQLKQGSKRNQSIGAFPSMNLRLSSYKTDGSSVLKQRSFSKAGKTIDSHVQTV